MKLYNWQLTSAHNIFYHFTSNKKNFIQKKFILSSFLAVSFLSMGFQEMTCLFCA